LRPTPHCRAHRDEEATQSPDAVHDPAAPLNEPRLELPLQLGPGMLPGSVRAIRGIDGEEYRGGCTPVVLALPALGERRGFTVMPSRSSRSISAALNQAGSKPSAARHRIARSAGAAQVFSILYECTWPWVVGRSVPGIESKIMRPSRTQNPCTELCVSPPTGQPSSILWSCPVSRCRTRMLPSSHSISSGLNAGQ
jgi:hypothetical protein